LYAGFEFKIYFKTDGYEKHVCPTPLIVNSHNVFLFSSKEVSGLTEAQYAEMINSQQYRFLAKNMVPQTGGQGC
jgi:hypothetical protein